LRPLPTGSAVAKWQVSCSVYGVVRDLILNYEVDVAVLQWCRCI